MLVAMRKMWTPVGRQRPSRSLKNCCTHAYWKKRGQPTCAPIDNAAFEAMKAVEIAVRDAAGYGPEKIGVNLIQEAFSQSKGPLADTTAPPAEQVSRMNLFWGAIGSYKNPQSHRDVNLGDPVEALEIILQITYCG